MAPILRTCVNRALAALGAALLKLGSGVVAMVAVTATPAFAAVDRADLIRIGASVLKIEARREQGGYSLGSGVVVAPAHVVTNCHVTSEATDVFVLRGDVRWRVQAQAVDAEHDLCVLRVPGIEATAVPLGRAAELAPGQGVTAVGYTGGMGIQSSSGVVVALHRMDGGRVVQSTNWFTSGASGGALFDDDHRLVGVLTFRLRGGENHYFAAPAEWVAALLLTDAAAYRPVAPLRGEVLAYWQQQPARQPRFLQAIALERDRQWTELEALAIEWSRSDGTDPQPWALQGLALDRQGRLPEARQAMERSLQLEPGAGPVWLRLGLLFARQGDRDRARQAHRRLDRLDPALARELKAVIDKADKT